MEVHHHPHVEKKRFKEYFLEFLMIFLAVTLGFFAENIREGISEKHTAKELAVSLYNDLKSDTEALNKIAVFRNKKEETMNHLLEILKQNPKKINASLFFRLIIPAFSTDDFSEKQSAGTITQLKNAGYLRYYTHTDIPTTLARYESSVNSLFSMERLEEQETYNDGIKFLKEEIDPALFNAGYGNGNISRDADIIPVNPGAFRLLYGNCVAIGILNRNIDHHFLLATKKNAVALMTILRKEYHMENE